MHDHASELTLGLSFLLGALHALEPGHGKTAMFVYMIGGRRSRWHPIVMGLSTALSHSVSLFVIAFMVHVAHHLVMGDHHHEEAASTILQWISAGLVLAVGGGMLLQALRGKSGNCCPHHAEHPREPDARRSGSTHGAHAHDLVQLGTPAVSCCSHSHAPAAVSAAEEGESRGSYRTTALLGLAVGLLPCPSALAAYFTGLSTGAPGTAYLIIALFAAGIACSLSLTGFVLQRFGDRLGGRFRAASRARWAIVRSALIFAVGLFYTGRLLL